uniref:DMT family transporter n=1 Tax=Fervidicoccus fontis TaxID=683846 RepID=A0A7J3ZKN1_9CREN
MRRLLPVRLYLLLAVAWLCISVSSILVLLSGATALQAAFWRVLLSTVIVLLGGIAYRRRARMPRFDAYSMVSGVLLGLHFLVWMKSLFLIPVALSTALVVWYPGISALVDRVFMKERVNRLQTIGFLMALAGTLYMLLPGCKTAALSERWALGSSLAVLGAFLAAGYFSIGRHLRRSGVELVDYTLVAYASAALTLLAYAAFTKGSLIPPKGSWPYLALLAVVPMIGGHTTMNYLLKYLKTLSVTSIAIGEPAGATVLAYLVLDQRPQLQVASGMLATIAGIYLIVRGEKSRER